MPSSHGTVASSRHRNTYGKGGRKHTNSNLDLSPVDDRVYGDYTPYPTVDRDDIGPDAVGEGNIADGSIVNSKLAAGAVEMLNFASGIIPPRVVTSLPTVPSADWPEGSTAFLTTDEKLYRCTGGTWIVTTDGADIVADSITAGQIAAGAIGVDELAAGAVTAEKLTVGTWSENLVANALFEDSAFADGTKPACWSQYEISGSGATWGRSTGASRISGTASLEMYIPNSSAGIGIGSNYIPVVPSAVYGLSVYAYAFYASSAGMYIRAKWYDASQVHISSSDIVSGGAFSTSVTQYAGSVTAPSTAKFVVIQLFCWTSAGFTTYPAYIYWDSVNFRQVIVSAMIKDGAITADKIESNAVTTSKLLVTAPGSALNADPGIADPSAWTTGSTYMTTVSDGKVGNKVLLNWNGTSVFPIGVDYIPVDPNKTYRIRCWARCTNSAAGGFYLGVALLDSSGVNIAGDGTWWWYAASNATVPVGWTEYVYTFGYGTAKTFPSNARSMSPLVGLGYSDGSKHHQAQDVRIEEVIPSTLIQDGAITTGKMTANSINGDRITAGTLHASKITAGSITSAEIMAGTIVASDIATGTITANEIAANAIGASELLVSSPQLQFDNAACQGTTGWIFDNGGNASNSWVASSWPGAPNYSCIIVAKGATAGTEYFGMYTASLIGVVPSTPVVISAWVAYYQAWRNIGFGFHEYNSAGTWIAFQFATVTSGNGVRRSVKLTPSASTYFIRPAFYQSSASNGDCMIISDVRVDYESAAVAGGGSVLIDQTGVTITNGKLTVASDSGSTVIIDGTSMMFKVAASGSTSVYVSHNSYGTSSVKITALGTGLSSAPAFLSYVGPGTSAADLKFLGYSGTNYGSTDRFVASTSGGSATSRVVTVDLMATTASYISGGEAYIALACYNASGAAVTYYCNKYYILKETAM